MKRRPKNVNDNAVDGVKNDPPLPKGTEKARNAAREQVRAEVFLWYEAATKGRVPLDQMQQVEIVDGHGQKQWRLEPEVPGVDNPVVVEGTQGGQWFIKIVPVPPKIRIFIP